MTDNSDIIKLAEEELFSLGEYGEPIRLRTFEQLLGALKIARAQLEHQRIDTVERLREFRPTPELLGGVLIKSLGCPSFGGVYELNYDGTWNDFDGEGGRDRVAPEDVPLPAYVLWIPETNPTTAEAK